jgi:hypothetical protein
LWRTPKADDGAHGSASYGGILKRLEKGQTIRLQDQVNHPSLFRTPGAKRMEMFPTPRAADAEKGLRSPEGMLKELNRGHGINLPAHVWIFPTPAMRGNPNKRDVLPESGTEGCPEQLNAANKGALNPEWVEWLQGLPVGWTDIGG